MYPIGDSTGYREHWSRVSPIPAIWSDYAQQSLIRSKDILGVAIDRLPAIDAAKLFRLIARNPKQFDISGDPESKIYAKSVMPHMIECIMANPELFLPKLKSRIEAGKVRPEILATFVKALGFGETSDLIAKWMENYGQNTWGNSPGWWTIVNELGIKNLPIRKLFNDWTAKSLAERNYRLKPEDLHDHHVVEAMLHRHGQGLNEYRESKIFWQKPVWRDVLLNCNLGVEEEIVISILASFDSIKPETIEWLKANLLSACDRSRLFQEALMKIAWTDQSIKLKKEQRCNNEVRLRRLARFIAVNGEEERLPDWATDDYRNSHFLPFIIRTGPRILYEEPEVSLTIMSHEEELDLFFANREAGWDMIKGFCQEPQRWERLFQTDEEKRRLIGWMLHHSERLFKGVWIKWVVYFKLLDDRRIISHLRKIATEGGDGDGYDAHCAFDALASANGE